LIRSLLVNVTVTVITLITVAGLLAGVAARPAS